MPLPIPDFQIEIRGTGPASGKTMLQSVLYRALLEAGYKDIMVINDDDAASFLRKDAAWLENVRNNSPEYFEKRVVLIESHRRLTLDETVNSPAYQLIALHAKTKAGEQLTSDELQTAAQILTSLPVETLEKLVGVRSVDGEDDASSPDRA